MSARKMLVVLFCSLALTGAAWAQDVQPAPAPATPTPAAPAPGFPAQTLNFQIGGGGVVGGILRANLSEKVSFGMGVMLRPITIVDEFDDSSSTRLGVFLPVECAFWTPGKGGDKGPNRHGLGLMAGFGFGTITEVGAGVYYDYNRFTKSNHVYNAGVGLAFFAPVSVPDDMTADATAAIYWKFAWGWGVK